VLAVPEDPEHVAALRLHREARRHRPWGSHMVRLRTRCGWTICSAGGEGVSTTATSDAETVHGSDGEGVAKHIGKLRKAIRRSERRRHKLRV
jgi:hypothetical protein